MSTTEKKESIKENISKGLENVGRMVGRDEEVPKEQKSGGMKSKFSESGGGHAYVPGKKNVMNTCVWPILGFLSLSTIPLAIGATVISFMKTDWRTLKAKGEHMAKSVSVQGGGMLGKAFSGGESGGKAKGGGESGGKAMGGGGGKVVGYSTRHNAPFLEKVKDKLGIKVKEDESLSREEIAQRIGDARYASPKDEQGGASYLKPLRHYDFPEDQVTEEPSEILGIVGSQLAHDIRRSKGLVGSETKF